MRKRRYNNIAPGFLTDMSIDWNIYLLGRIWADGHISKTAIILYAREDDAQHMLPFIGKMGIYSIYIRQAKKDGKPFGKKSCTISIHKRDLRQWMIDRDYGEKSVAAPTKILNEIPENKRYLFWLGYLDGDGCIYVSDTTRKKAINFWSTLEQDWSELEKVCKRLQVDYSINKYIRKGGKHKSSTLEMRRIQSCINLCKYLYQSYEKDNIGLVRKREKYVRIMELAKNVAVKSSRHKGISWLKNEGKWRASIYFNKANRLKKDMILGQFNTEEDAHQARIKKMKELGLVDVDNYSKDHIIVSNM